VSTGGWLRAARNLKGWTQGEAAERLGVSQPYWSLLEHGRRRVSKRLLPRLQRHFDVPVTTLPVEASRALGDPQHLAEAVGALGYPGFAHLRPRRRRRYNPAQVLLAALLTRHLETRVAEALPWVVVHHPELNWNWVINEAKLNDAQNRVGFVLTLAREVAERAGDHATASTLGAVEQRLEPSRLAREDTFCREAMTQSERRWLREQRPPQARHWHLLTDLRAELLPYAA
jgi:transcriptional regulator with XRE-family HTH domain